MSPHAGSPSEGEEASDDASRIGSVWLETVTGSAPRDDASAGVRVGRGDGDGRVVGVGVGSGVGRDVAVERGVAVGGGVLDAVVRFGRTPSILVLPGGGAEPK